MTVSLLCGAHLADVVPRMQFRDVGQLALDSVSWLGGANCEHFVGFEIAVARDVVEFVSCCEQYSLLPECMTKIH
jgi:hypothetical protein